MKKGIVFLFLICLTLATKAQKNYFIYVQTDNKQAFSVKMNGKDLSSSASGYIVIPKLPKGDHSFTISFPKNEWPKQTFNISLNSNDEGYMLKNFSEKGWGLFNLQSMDIVMNGDPFKKTGKADDEPMAKVEKVVEAPVVKVDKVNTVEKVVEAFAVKVENVEETPVVKVATNNANRAPVKPIVQEPAVEIPVAKVEEKVVVPIKEMPAAKVEEKVVVPIKEMPAVKIEEKVVEPIKEKPEVKIEEKYTASEEKVATKSKDLISKVSSYDDIDGITITYKVVTASGIDMVPIFVEKNMVLSTETSIPKTEEKFIEHIELKNPNENKAEKTEDPTTAKVATNNANRAPIEKVNTVEKVEKVKEETSVVEKPVVEKPVVEKPVVEKPAVEKQKVEIPTVEKPKVEKVAEKIEEPIKSQIPPVAEKPVEFGNNNPLKITEAEKSSRTSRNITNINSDCADRKAENDDFFKTRKKMIAEDSNEDAMVDAALKQFKLKCYSVEQIKNLAILFLTDEGKYKLVDAAYPYTHESNLYASLEPLFKEAYYIKRFKAMLDR